MAINTGALNFKIVLLGEGCVGKTSLLIRYIEDKFHSQHVTTIQASFLNKKLNIDGKRVNLSIWDTAGQEQFHALGPIYYRSSNGAILLYDITDERSLHKVKVWVKELKKIVGSDIVLMIAGNKVDLEKDRNVSIEEAERYAESVGATHFHTSAKMNIGIEELFLEMTSQLIQKAESNKQNDTRQNNNIVIIDDEQVVKKSCCGSSPNS